MKLILDYYIKGLAPKELKFEECYVIPYEGFKKLNKWKGEYSLDLDRKLVVN